MHPQGKLFIIGGAEYKGEETADMETKNIKFKRYEILKELLITSKNKPIEIITSGSRVPGQVRKSYENAFKRMRYTPPGFLPIRSREDARDKSFIRRIKEAGAVFFSGGDQSRLAHILRNTSIINLIKYRYLEDPDFLLAGTSAGAMAFSDIMIAGGGNSEAILAGDLKLSKGLNISSNCIIDTHFIKRGRFGRLAQAIALYPSHLGIGLGEDTALIIRQGKEAECRGSGMVVIIDGSRIKASNAPEARKGEPIYVGNLKVHLLIKGSRFSIKNRELF